MSVESGQGVSTATSLAQAVSSATTKYSLAPVTLEWDSTTSAASIYGVSGSSVQGIVSTGDIGSSSVSVWQYNSGDGSLTSTTAFSIATSGVSNAHAAPVISGGSVFYIVSSLTGISIVQFDKQDLTVGGDNIMGAGVASAWVVEPLNTTAGNNAQFIPTPCVSGDSIYVVDNLGGLTRYYTQDLSSTWMFQFNTTNQAAGVTASPVTDGTYLVLCSASSVSNYEIDNLSGNSIEWAHDFGNPARYQIWQTPVISNGYVWVLVRDLTAGDTQIHRFQLADNTTDGNRSLLQTIADSYADHIVVNDDIWTATYNPTVERIPQTNFARGYSYWPQFKFDAAKTGHNTEPADPDQPPAGTSGGCFISTIK